jgi:hypothetical protein
MSRPLIQSELSSMIVQIDHDLTPQANRFPYVLVCSTLGTIISLAAVWIATAYTYAPAIVA